MSYGLGSNFSNPRRAVTRERLFLHAQEMRSSVRSLAQSFGLPTVG